MRSDFLSKNIESQASASNGGYVAYGYGQVEPNHLSAQRTSQIYAQLPADKTISVLEQGQFVKYDYANGLVNFTGAGEWMLVYNEIKLYREEQVDCEFAMVKGNYKANVYSPYGTPEKEFQSRDYSDIVAPEDMYDINYNSNPFNVIGRYSEALMPEGTTMVPRVFKTNVGDIYTTNMVKETELAVGNLLTPGADGILAKAGAADADMQWQVVKIYTMADNQPAVKLMRVK